MIHRINVFLLSVIIGFLPAYVFAASTPEDIWLREITKNVDSTGRTTGYTIDASKRTIVNGTARDMSSKLLDYKPNKAAVGGVMKKRLTQAAVGGGVALIGVAIVDSLLRGIGWIMEDGVYVKKIINDPEANPQYIWIVNGISVTAGSTPQAACNNAYNFYMPPDSGTTYKEANSVDGVNWFCPSPQFGRASRGAAITRQNNPNYDPTKPNTETKIPITDSELADIMFGDYAGDSSANIQPKNDGTHTGVQETMQPDPNAGEGTKDKPENPVSKDVDQKLDANPNKKVTDHKSTDSKGDEETTKEDGTKEQTKTDTKTELPAFCNYAASLCKWIDWTQNDELPEKDDTDLEVNVPIPTKTVSVNFGAQCPAPVSYPFSMGGYSTTIPLIKFEPLCATAPIVKPSIIALASIGAAFIIFGRGKSE